MADHRLVGPKLSRDKRSHDAACSCGAWEMSVPIRLRGATHDNIIRIEHERHANKRKGLK